jgi:hypothetical protein
LTRTFRWNFVLFWVFVAGFGAVDSFRNPAVGISQMAPQLPTDERFAAILNPRTSPKVTLEVRKRTILWCL